MVSAFHQKVVAIRVEPPNPRIGEHAVVHFRTGGGRARVIINGCDSKQINDGAALPLCLHDDRCVEITMVDELGAFLAREIVRPYVIIPTLLFLDLKPSVTYAERVLMVRGAASNVERVWLQWRIVGGGDWSPPKQGHRNGAFEFDVPIPGFLSQLEIRVGLESCDAEVAPATARIVVPPRTVSIGHPEPTINFSCASNSAVRFASSPCGIRCRWVAEGELEYNGVRQRLSPDSNHDVVVEVPLDTARVGAHVLHVRVVGLNGRELSGRHEIEVKSRKLRVRTKSLPDGSVEFSLSGCSNVRLRIPANRTEIALGRSQGIIRHAFLTPTEAILDYTDDSGVVRSRRLVLGRAPGPWIGSF